MKHSRTGSIVKWIAIVLGVVLVAGAGVAFYAYKRVTSGSSKPLEIADVSAQPEVLTSLKRRVEQHTYVGASPAPAASPASGPGSVSLTADELTLLVLKMLPPIPQLKLAIGIVDGNADIKMSVPSKELMKVAGNALGSAGDYIEKNLVWLNVSAIGTIKFSENRLSIAVKTVRQPDWMSASQLQDILQGAVKDRAPGPLVVPLDDVPFQVLDLELAGDVAIAKVQRVSK